MSQTETVSTSIFLQSIVNTPENFVAGKIGNFLKAWGDITSDKVILDIVENGFDIQFESPPCKACSRKEIKFNQQEQLIIDDLLLKFINKKVVEVATHESNEVLSHIFIRPKADGTYRLILNLRNLNEHIEHVHFKMETLKNVLSLVQRNCYFAKIDLKDAYYSIPVAIQSRKFLRFTWRGVLYQYTCVPNGLGVAPRNYTKLMKPVFSTLRKLGHINVTYIDDSLLQSDTYGDCIRNIEDTITLVDRLGLTVHPEKSMLVPTQCIEFIGFLINSVDMTVRLTPHKADAIVTLCLRLLRRKEITIREFAQLIGKLVASEPGVMYAPLYYKVLEIEKDEKLKAAKGNFDSRMTLSEKSQQCLHWWVENVRTAFKPISLPNVDRIIESDSSSFGYGARDVTFKQVFSGLWDMQDKSKHINFLELKAAYLALKGLCSEVQNEHIQLYLDNTTAIKYLSKMGGRKTELNDLSREIWKWCSARKIVLSVFHIPGTENSFADKLSRQKINVDMEWKMNEEIFRALMRKYGKFDIDLFASDQNYQLVPYASYLPDAKAFAINAFSLNWGKFYCYIFPPFSVLNQVLKKLEDDKAEGLVIAPLFTTQPWFPRLLQMVVDHPVILPKSNNLLRQPGTELTHPLKKMVLVAFRVSGKTCAAQEFQRRLPILFCQPGDLVQNDSIKHMCQNGYHFVVKGRSLLFNHL